VKNEKTAASVCRNCNILMLKQAESGKNGLSGLSENNPRSDVVSGYFHGLLWLWPVNLVQPAGLSGLPLSNTL